MSGQVGGFSGTVNVQNQTVAEGIAVTCSVNLKKNGLVVQQLGFNSGNTSSSSTSVVVKYLAPSTTNSGDVIEIEMTWGEANVSYIAYTIQNGVWLRTTPPAQQSITTDNKQFTVTFSNAPFVWNLTVNDAA